MGSISIQLGVSAMDLKLLLKRPWLYTCQSEASSYLQITGVFDIFREIIHNDLAAILKYTVTETDHSKTQVCDIFIHLDQ